MKKKLSFLTLMLVLALVIGTLAGCNSADRGESNLGGADYDGSYGDKNGASAPGFGTNNDSQDSALGTIPSGGIDNPAAKIIKTANASVSTKSYDEFLTKLYEKITAYGGYTDSESFRTSGKLRYATVVIRIPAGSLEAFKNELSGLGTMTSYSAFKQDVTLTYETLVAEVETLTAEAAVIEELFAVAKASGDLAKISEIEKRLTDVKLRIAEAKAELKVYDNSIAYSTVNLNVNEVLEEPVIEEEEKNAFQRIGENLLKNLSDIGNFFVEIFVFIISALPYLLIIGAVATGVIFITVKINKKTKAKIEEYEKAKAAKNEKNEEDKS